MLGLFEKKKEEPKSSAEIPVGAPQAFETGKEVHFKDPKSGEFVYQRALAPEHRKTIMDAMQKNAQLANQFMGASRQFLAFQEQMNNTHKAIIASEQEINKAIERVRDEMKLDKRWGLNFPLGLLERRDPPSV